jgi:hypothetical protein
MSKIHYETAANYNKFIVAGIKSAIERNVKVINIEIVDAHFKSGRINSALFVVNRDNFDGFIVEARKVKNKIETKTVGISN